MRAAGPACRCRTVPPGSAAAERNRALAVGKAPAASINILTPVAAVIKHTNTAGVDMLSP